MSVVPVKLTEEERATQLVRDFSKYVNNMCCDTKLFARLVTNEHRTLQQTMFQAMLECMKMWSDAKANGRYDARNEYTVDTSRKIMDMLNGHTGTPFI